MSGRCHALLVLCFGVVVAPLHAQPGKTIEFNRDIRPILSNHCFVCHGPDNNLRKAKLRLDTDKEAPGVHGAASVVVAGKPGESELMDRLLSKEPTKRMPPPKANKDLSKEQIELLRQWIAQGAKYDGHWSLLAAKKHDVPTVKTPAWVRNPVDAFILAQIEKAGFKPSPEADRRTLLRRLSFDLIGLPPTPEEIAAFEKDNSDNAYEKQLERLLASPHFGERMAIFWLDQVRFADTGGYHSDNHRDLWPFRDWVIKAFNENLPYDQFTTWQLAGDLLPSATVEQKIASGYNRLLQTTEEGGAQAKEYQAKYYADRVRNVSTVWLGLTMGCSECHDHKFDPVSTKEFYQFASFFADVQEASVGRQGQTTLLMPEQQKQVQELLIRMAPLQKLMDEQTPELDKALAAWEADVKAKGLKGVAKEALPIFNLAPAKRNPKQVQALAKVFRAMTPLLAEPRGELAKLTQQKTAIEKSAPSTLITTSVAPRTIRILPRGNWLDDTGEIVQPTTPKSLPSLGVDKGRANRLDLAKWMVDKKNPLTARVFVNRLWALTFGQGIVKTMDDFGAQGTWPTHPELLDWLALEFQNGWDVKKVIRTLVTSNAYRQTSRPSEELKTKDPYNHLYARQARFRLDAEFVRDNALAVSGLLARKIGGPSVKPYQPAGYWAYLNFPRREWMNDRGENLYRRGLYTYWQRSFLHPSLLAFDAPTREECTVERARSNTPQQALALLNDPTYVEASRAFAVNVLREGGKDTAGRIDWAYRHALGRSPAPAETKLLTKLLDKHLAEYRADVKSAETLCKVGDYPLTKEFPSADVAGWTSVTRVILNLHETITRE